MTDRAEQPSLVLSASATTTVQAPVQVSSPVRGRVGILLRNQEPLVHQNARIQELDGLRAIAALAVFAFHAFGNPVITRFTKAGWIGVDLFFVISGYLITTILVGIRDESNYFKNFYMRRTLRIFPPYYLLLLVCGVCAALNAKYHFAVRLWIAFALYGTSLVAIRPWYPGSVAGLLGPSRAIEVTWSLSIEELFYLLWAPAVRFLRVRYLVVLLSTVILFAPGLRWYIHNTCHGMEYYFFPARADALSFGALLALWRASGKRIFVRGHFVVLGLLVCGCALFLPSDLLNNSGFVLFGYSLVACSMTLLLAFVLQRAGSGSRVCRCLRSSILVYLGTISYMFYLLHVFVIRAFLDWLPAFSSHYSVNRILQIVGSLAATLLLSAVSWKFFETPILRLKSRFNSQREMKAAAR